ncbi:hypothetical protein [Pedobacter nyackensis]|uniref:Uncharacterized protein n=1 Tax=Pedobacter nyackensis TaxID=475255 RepID=A0A1W2BLG2_9SPHI|nr:hypothetical protein [Pedobacter nyackensis]SMC73674.1 hypothetical protein SAMN04488101_102585 [Pedobacter nyackensis]
MEPTYEDCDGIAVPQDTIGGIVLPPLSNPTDTLNKIMRNTNLSEAQLAKLRTMLSRFLSGDGNERWACIHKQLYRHMASNNLKFDFMMNSNNLVPQSYNPVTSTFSFLNDDSFNYPNIFEHEFFHAFQDMFIATDTYAIATSEGYPDGYTNIEFETAVFTDLLKTNTVEYGAFMNADEELREDYSGWLNLIKDNNKKYPTTFDDFQGRYNFFLKKFQFNSGYADKGQILLNMKPVSLLEVFFNFSMQINPMKPS